MEHMYSIMPLDEVHFDEIVADIRDQYERRISSCPLFIAFTQQIPLTSFSQYIVLTTPSKSRNTTGNMASFPLNHKWLSYKRDGSHGVMGSYINVLHSLPLPIYA